MTTTKTIAELEAAYDAASRAYDLAVLANMHLPTDATRTREENARTVKVNASDAIIRAKREAA
jgi:hypothetical protein